MTTNEEQYKMLDYLSGDMSPEEKQAFDAWVSSSQEREEHFKQICRQFHSINWSQHWDSIDEGGAYKRIRQASKRRQLYIRVVRYAVVAIIVLGLGFHIFQQEYFQSQPTIFTTIPIPGDRRPVLTLHNGQSVVLADKGQTIAGSADGVRIELRDSGLLEYLPMADTATGSLNYNTLEVPNGCEFSLVLADGSRVWLNAGSSLKYPERFSNEKREVALEGEAYFEVTPNPKIPFIVHSGAMELEVLGTSFNIEAYPGEEKILTTLLTGSIAQRFTEQGKRIVLLPSQQSVYTIATGNTQVRKADLESVLAWRQEKFIARDERLEDILHKMGRWYGFRTVFTNPALKEERFHLHCPRYKELQAVLNTIQETQGIRFDIHENTVYVSR